MTNDITVSIVKSARKTIVLKPENGHLLVKAPFGTSDEFIANFLLKNSQWIRTHCAPRDITFLLWGKPIAREELINPDKKTDINSDSLAKLAHKRMCHNELQNFYLATAKKLGFTGVPFRICTMASAWGKCHSTGRIELHWKVATLPETLAMYVICHELAHLQHLDHSQKFWARVGELIPNARHLDRELKNYKLD